MSYGERYLRPVTISASISIIQSIILIFLALHNRAINLHVIFSSILNSLKHCETVTLANETFVSLRRGKCDGVILPHLVYHERKKNNYFVLLHQHINKKGKVPILLNQKYNQRLSFEFKQELILSKIIKTRENLSGGFQMLLKEYLKRAERDFRTLWIATSSR